LLYLLKFFKTTHPCNVSVDYAATLHLRQTISLSIK
jgi:hypothetical protein